MHESEEFKKEEIFEHSLKTSILHYIFSQFGTIDEIKGFEENAGSFWITLKNGDSYFLMVEKCDEEETEKA